MLSMVLALSGSSVGRRYLSQQSDLLLDLFSLLHTAGSARVQRQVISLLRRVLPEIKPFVLANLLGVKRLPVGVITENRDNNNRSTFDVQDMGILDVLLSVVAKALTVQTKIRGGGHSTTTGTSGRGHQRIISTVTLATAIHPKDDLGPRWFLRGCIPRKLAEMVMSLILDMSSGKFGDSWGMITKSAVAENILNMTRLPEELRNNPSDCIKTPTFWLNLASLCVLTEGDAERLSSTPVVTGVMEDQDNGNSPASSKPVRVSCHFHVARKHECFVLGMMPFVGFLSGVLYS
jgi:E3 ubiquitin-protein ligase MYCBP2